MEIVTLKVHLVAVTSLCTSQHNNAEMECNNLHKRPGELAKLPEKEIEYYARGLAEYDLLDLLDSGFRKVVEVAAGELHKRGCVRLVAEVLLSHEIKTTPGKVAAFNICFAYGRGCPRIKDICLQYLHDSSSTIVVGALFGLVFLGEKDVIPALKTAAEHIRRPDDCRKKAILSAIKALEYGNPFLYEYAKYVTFGGNPWELDMGKYPYRFLRRK